jgi:hypothetical protein
VVNMEGDEEENWRKQIVRAHPSRETMWGIPRLS